MRRLFVALFWDNVCNHACHIVGNAREVIMLMSQSTDANTRRESLATSHEHAILTTTRCVILTENKEASAMEVSAA